MARQELLLKRILVAVVLFAASLVPGQEPRVKADELYQRARLLFTGARSADPAIGRDLLRRSADLGYMPAQTALGTLYHTSDPQEARKWYEKAAPQGSLTSAWALGSLYLGGALGGANRDLAEKWLAKAADAGDPFGAYLLATSLADRDAPRAVKYFRIAAQQGLPFAQLRLGELYFHGAVGIPVDKREAYFWLLVSRDGVAGAADGELSQVEGDLVREDVEAIKAKAFDQRTKLSRATNAHGCTGWESELSAAPGPPPLELQKACGY
jgi:TPR repeat protein